MDQQQGTSTPTGVSGVDPMGADVRAKDQQGECPTQEETAQHPQAQQAQQPGGGGAPGTGG